MCRGWSGGQKVCSVPSHFAAAVDETYERPEENALTWEDPKSGEIPIVVSRDGSALRLLKDCSAWQEKHQKARRSFKMRAAAAGIESGSDDSDGELGRPVKTRQEVRSAPRDQSSGRKQAKITKVFLDSPDSDTHQQRKKSTYQRQVSSRKRTRDASDEEEARPRQKGKVHRRGEVSADEEEEERRRRKKAKKMHGGDYRRDAGKDSHRSAKPGPSKRSSKTSDDGTDSSEGELSDTD